MAEMTKKPAMRSILLVALFLVASPAHAVVICGEDWITFTGTQLTLKKEHDVTSGDLWHRIDGRFTLMIRDYLRAKSNLACLTDRIQKQSGAVTQVGDNMKLDHQSYGSLLSAWDAVDWEALGKDMGSLREQVAEKERLQGLLRNTEFAGMIEGGRT